MYTDSYVSPTIRLSKRLFDLMGSIFLLTLTLPFFPLIALAIKLDSKGPVFFKQMRIGQATPQATHLFMMVKFRTMRSDAEALTGAVWATKNDPRITRTGKFLRQTRLDELPQLFNVLKGEMSLIGPRPERPGICRKLDSAIPFYVERTYNVLPGITGLAQVSQGYDESLEDVRSKIGYDHAYALALGSFGTWLRIDLEITLRTLLVMFGRKGQ